MKTHRWIPHVVAQERAVPAEALTGAHRAYPKAQAASRILVLALVLGSLGADAAAFASLDHANAHQAMVAIDHAAGASLNSISHPWMY
jgi:hypothetical protein